MNLTLLKAELTRDEGNVPYVYDDATGKPIVKGSVVEGYPTCGVGFLLDHSKGARIPQPVIDFWLDFLLTALNARLLGAFSWYGDLDEIRQRVIANMAYNLGVDGLLGFHRMLDACERKDYDAAADEMADSKWAKQVGDRAVRLIAMMRTGGV